MILEWLDGEIAMAMRRIERAINRRLHHAQRSAGQRKRREKEKAKT